MKRKCEITRIPNTIKSDKMKPEFIPGPYRLGKGHVKWFTTRLGWLYRRYNEIHQECLNRGYNVTYKWPDGIDIALFNDYVVTEQDLEINRKRIEERT